MQKYEKHNKDDWTIKMYSVLFIHVDSSAVNVYNCS